MIDRWYYTHGGKTLGPVTTAALRDLASKGGLDGTDWIWPEGRQQSEAIEARCALDFASMPVVLDKKPAWLDDIRNAVQTESKSAGKSSETVQPDWLEDVRAAEEIEQSFLTTFEFDAESGLVPEEEISVELLKEPEEVVEVEPVKPPVPKRAATTPRRLLVGSATSPGRLRDRNEDSLLVQQWSWSNREERHDVAAIVVADGMGGHASGDKASGLVVRVLCGALTPLVTEVMTQTAPAVPDLAEILSNALREANRVVREAAQENTACKGMGSTAVALLIWDGRTSICLVGDCRVYHWRTGNLRQVTVDQTLVARMVELGQLTPEEAAKHPRRSEVAQAIGKYALIEPGSYELILKPGDWLVASSDGLQAHVDNLVLGETIAKAGSSASALASRLVELANQAGGSDNCTVAVVRCV